MKTIGYLPIDENKQTTDKQTEDKTTEKLKDEANQKTKR